MWWGGASRAAGCDLCQVAVSGAPQRAHIRPHLSPIPSPPPPQKLGCMPGQQLPPAAGGVRVSGPAEVLSSQDAAPGRAWAQLDDAAADGYQWRLPSFITNLCATAAGATAEELAVVETLCSVRGVPGEEIRSVVRFCRRDLCESETRCVLRAWT